MKTPEYSDLGIRNCIFQFKCSKTWASLTPTNNADIRACDECGKSVYRCRTDSELVDAVSKNRCVAIFREKPDSGISTSVKLVPILPTYPIELMGYVETLEVNERDPFEDNGKW